MKFTFALLGAVAAAVDADTERAFINYIAENGKSYGTREEYEFRLNVFAAKSKFIEEHNSRNEGDHVVAHNHMSDWTDHEYKKLLGYQAHLKKASQNVFSGNATDIPDAINWVDRGAVTAVKNQGQCGSCWAFSTTGSLEGRFQIQTGDLVSMSEQQLVDCSTQNSGCQGGLMDLAFDYVKTTPIDTEESYGYTGKQGTCHADSGKTVVEDISHTDVKVNDPAALMAAAATGPVSIAVDAAALGWQLYRGGVLKRFCGTSLDHGVLLVGYGSDNGTDYWLVKNSWGAGWGEKGYIRLLRDDKAGAGTCGLQQQASFPNM